MHLLLHMCAFIFVFLNVYVCMRRGICYMCYEKKYGPIKTHLSSLHHLLYVTTNVERVRVNVRHMM